MKKTTLIGIVVAVVIAAWFFLVVVGGMISLIAKLVSPELENLEGNVAVVDVKGVITESDEVRHQIERLKGMSSVKAVVVRFDSPGGGVGASQEIFEAVEELKKRYPVVASMGSVAASGAFWAAMACDKIVANPGTLTGSIGVIFEYFELDQALRKISIEPVVIKSGFFKDAGSPFRKLTEGERALFSEMLGDVHAQFQAVIAKSRKLDPARVAKFSDGRVFTGKKAKELGLVDELGGIDKAIAIAAQAAKISGEAKPVYLKEKKWYDKLLRSVAKMAIELKIPQPLLLSVVQ